MNKSTSKKNKKSLGVLILKRIETNVSSEKLTNLGQSIKNLKNFYSHQKIEISKKFYILS